MYKTFKTLFTIFLGILFFIPTFTANSAEETIEESVVPATRPATFLSPFDIFMEFGGEEDEFESEHSS